MYSSSASSTTKMQKRCIILFYTINSMTAIKFFHLFYTIEPDVINHIPVEDNPVYITMKKIDLKKNSAYEIIIVSER